MRKMKFILLIGLLALGAGLFGCSGDDGDDGATGAAGAAGQSAYELAVENGFVGTEEEWLASLEGAGVPLFDESCNVCHGVNDDLAIANFHPVILEEPVIAGVTVTRAADNTLTVDFSVSSAAGPLVGLGSAPSALGDLRVYLADIVPAGTVTGNAPQTTWPTAFPEMYAETRGDDVGVTFTDNLDGTYTYVIPPAILDTDFAVNAPEGDLATHQQRILVRADARDFAGLNRTAFVADFTMPAAGGAAVAASGTTRTIVVESACTACHGDPLENAAHGGGYQSPQACVMCHSPIGALPEGATTLGDEMQALEAWSASLIHKIHAAIDMPAFPTRILGNGYSDVTYPKDIKNCEVCHVDDGQDLADYWKTNPTIEACTTCHEDTTFSGAAPTHSGGAATNASCTFCHPATGTGFGQSITDAHAVTITKVYDSTISLSADDDATPALYEAGDEILVTVTVANVAGGGQTGSYTDPTAFDSANIYVYGPRAKAVPVLTTGSTTDPDFVLDLTVDPSLTPDQGRSMMIDDAASDPLIQTDATGFKYQLMAIPADLAPGTYMVQVAVDHPSSRVAGSRNYAIDGWALVTFQVGTATEEPKVAGECTTCHTQEDWGSMYHRSYFGTDGCIACHDQSGNHADPLTNRVHAVHAATVSGDLLDADWSHITYPRELESCQACHNSTSETFMTAPNGSWGYACIGCHGDTDGALDHMLQNGAPFLTEE